jgi:hypothetical protein
MRLLLANANTTGAITKASVAAATPRFGAPVIATRVENVIVGHVLPDGIACAMVLAEALLRLGLPRATVGSLAAARQRGAFREAGGTAARSHPMMSVDVRAGNAHHLSPFHVLGLDIGVELGGGAADRLAADLTQPGRNHRVIGGGLDSQAQAFDHGLGRARRGLHTEPRHGLKTRQSAANRWHVGVGEPGIPGGDGQKAQPAVTNMRQVGGQVVD